MDNKVNMGVNVGLEKELADFALEPVPEADRYSALAIFFVLVGAFVSVFSFTTGAAIARGLSFSNTMWAVFIGGMLIQLPLMIITGNIGLKTGLTTAYLTRYLGFGKYGSILTSCVVFFATFGWLTYGIAIMGHSLALLLHMNEPLAIVISGIAVIIVTTFGFKGLEKVATVLVPIFIVIMLVGLGRVLNEVGGLSKAMSIVPPDVGKVSFIDGIMMSTGLFVAGSIIMADVTRYAKKLSHVGISSAVSAFLGLFLITAAGALMCLATGEWDPSLLIIKYLGLSGTVFLIFIAYTTVDYDLYLSTLYAVNILGLFGDDKKIEKKRPVINAVIAVASTLIAALGILNLFANFLFAMATYMPAIGGVLIGSFYFVLKSKPDLKKAKPYVVDWAGIISYVIGTAIVMWTQKTGFFIPAVNGIVVSCILYALLANLNMNSYRHVLN